MNDIPEPINTQDVCLDQEILALGELLAKNTHSVWAQERLRQGWTWGPVRDDHKKEHPCLIPYEQLSEEEKNYDRATSLETLKVILSLGYEIRKMP